MYLLWNEENKYWTLHVQFYREEEAKYLKRRIENVEKYFGQICEIIGSIARKNARLRDKGKIDSIYVTIFVSFNQLEKIFLPEILQITYLFC